jgi:thioredoxin reductase (NADPH)
MTDNAQPVPLTPESRADQAFPTLTPAQVARVHTHGRVRQVKSDEVLVDAGEQSTRFFVVTAGEVHLVRQSGEGT